MSRKIQRVKPLTVRDVERAWMVAHGTGDTALAAQEIVTTSNQKRLWRGDGTLLSGGVDHGTVATEAALATIYLLPSCTRGVWPGDTAFVSAAGCEYRCISGANATAVWRAVGAGVVAGTTATFAGLSGAPGDNAALAATLNGKAPLNSPALTGTPTAPTQLAEDNSTKLATTAFVAAAIAAGQSGWEVAEDGPDPAETACTWSGNGDTNGAVYRIGALFGAQAWANPAVRTFATAGKVGVLSSGDSSTETTVTDHAWPQGGDMTVGSGAWFALDFGDYLIRPNGYTIAASNYHAIRGWKVQGANTVAGWNTTDIAAATWTDLHIVPSNSDLSQTTLSWTHQTMTAPETGYRFIRLVETSTASGSHYLCILEFELYGALLRPIALPANAGGWLTDGAGHFVPYYCS